MNSLHAFPKWMWFLVLALLAVGILLFALSWFFKPTGPTLPPGLAEKRQTAADMLNQAAAIKDVNIQLLVDLEAKKDYAGAVALMDQAMSVNNQYQNLNSSLRSVAAELSGLAVLVKPDDLGIQAVKAFSGLQHYADAAGKYYDDRAALYDITREYYVGLLAKQKLPIPDALKDAVALVTNDQAQAVSLKTEFASAIQAFDQAAGGK